MAASRAPLARRACQRDRNQVGAARAMSLRTLREDKPEDVYRG